MSVRLSAENVIFASVLGGFIRLIEMLLVCVWGCLQRMLYLHVFLRCFYTLN